MEKPKSKRGFASMSAEKRRSVASMGGKACPKEKRQFFVNRELARLAGQKGKRLKKATQTKEHDNVA